jgi:putative inorganic carbon (hco3(-)) transporter
MNANIHMPSLVEGPESASPKKRVLRSEGAATQKRGRTLAFPAVLMAFFLFSQLFNYQALGLSTFTPDKFIFLLIALLFAYGALTHQLRPVAQSKIEVCMFLFATLCAISYAITNPDAGLPHYKWLTSLFNLILYPFGVYLLAKRTSYSFAKTKWLLWAIVCIGVYLGFTAWFEHYKLVAFIFPKYIMDRHVGIQFGRARGPMVGSNPMGEWLILVYLAICLVMPYTQKAWRFLLYALISVVIVGIYFTFTRGVWLSFAAVVIMTAARGGRFRTPSRIVIGMVILGFLSGAGSKFSASGDTLFSRRQNTIDYRISNDITTYRMGMANPLTGCGYGSFFKNWRKYFTGDAKQLTGDLTDGNHNVYLGLFADLGFPGVALYLTMLGFLLKEVLRVRKSLGRSMQFERHLALTAACMLIVLLMEGMEGDLRFNPTLNTMTFLFAGITASITRGVAARLRGKVAGVGNGRLQLGVGRHNTSQSVFSPSGT